MSYRDQLRDPRWQRKRLETLSEADWKCSRCGNHRRTLHVHHLSYRPVAPWDYDRSELEVLCDPCHREAHKFLRGQGRFAPGQPYSRLKIASILGGATTGFLPMHQGHVVCGCFRYKFNPDAPGILLPGDLDHITEPAELFCRQSFPIPIFLYDSGAGGWVYKGDWQVESWTENPREIAIHNERSSRKTVSRVIFLREAKD